MTQAFGVCMNENCFGKERNHRLMFPWAVGTVSLLSLPTSPQGGGELCIMKGMESSGL